VEIFVPKDKYPEEGRRYGSRKLDWNDTVARFWKNKQTGQRVEVARFLRAIDKAGIVTERRIVYFDPELAGYVDEETGKEERSTVSEEFEKFKSQFEPIGNV
jgi:hypothetical protein